MRGTPWFYDVAFWQLEMCGPPVRNLCDSTKSNLPQLICIFHFAVRVAESRRGTPAGKTAEVFLDTMTAGMLLLLGMLADAGSEGLGLIRSLDSEDTEAADLCQSISDFLDHIVWLFHDRGCEMIQGHLQAVLAWLSQPHFFL